MEKLVNAMKTEIADVVIKTTAKNLKNKLNENGQLNTEKKFWVGNFNVKIKVH